MQYEIRPLTETDVEEFWQLRLRGLREHPEAFGMSYEESLERPMESVVERFKGQSIGGDNFILGAFSKGDLVGVVGFLRDQGIKMKHKGMIWGMYVAPEARGRGVGRALMKRAIAIGREQEGLELIYLAVVTVNQVARSLYRSLGFQAYGVELHALKIGDDYYDEELMMLRLKN